MIAPVLVGFLTAIVYMVLLIRAQWPLWPVRKRLYQLCPGFRWREQFFAIKLRKHPDAIFEESDSPEVRAMKEVYLRVLELLKTRTFKIFRIPLIGLALAIIAGFIEAIVRGKWQ